jgi:hypothetical protein
MAIHGGLFGFVESRRPGGPAPMIGGEVGMGRVLWEYRIINIRSENYRLDPNYEHRLNDLGDDGWELVAITAINFKTGATDHIGMVFKREKT